jgi:uncharacterized Tic20 family protein
MARFQSREEYERWRAGQQGEAPRPPEAEDSAPAEQIYDGPEPGSREFVDRSLRHAGLANNREKNLAMLCHLTALLGFLIPFGNLIGPVIVWMMGKSDSPFVDEHGKASLNFQISLTLYFIGVAVLGIFLGPLVVVLILVAGIAVLYGIVMIIVNAVKAHNGDEGVYALSTHFLS